MIKEEHIKYWLESAEHDLQTAQSLFKAEKFFLDQVTDFNIQTRYPDYQFDFYKMCTKEYAEFNFNRIKEYYQWLKSLLR